MVLIEKMTVLVTRKHSGLICSPTSAQTPLARDTRCEKPRPLQLGFVALLDAPGTTASGPSFFGRFHMGSDPLGGVIQQHRYETPSTGVKRTCCRTEPKRLKGSGLLVPKLGRAQVTCQRYFAYRIAKCSFVDLLQFSVLFHITRTL